MRRKDELKNSGVFSRYRRKVKEENKGATQKLERERDDITPEQREAVDRIRDQLSRSLPGFTERCLRVIDRDSPHGAAIIPFKLNACQLSLDRYIDEIRKFNVERSSALHKLDRNTPVSEFPVNIIILKARKTGVSTYIQARAFWKAEFNPHTNCLIMAHELSSAENIAKISSRFDQHFEFPLIPEELGGDGEAVLPIRKPLNRVSDQLLEWSSDGYHKSWDSRILVKTAGARTSGTSRGFSWHLCHISEEAHFKESDQVSAALAACVPFSETYEESTAKGTGGMFYNTWNNALRLDEAIRLWKQNLPFPPNWNGKFKFFWSWLDDPAYRRPLQDWEKLQLLESLTAREEDLIARFKATPEQIAWRRWKLGTECQSQSDMDPEMYFDQEYPTEPNDAFVATGDNAFIGKYLLAMQNHNKKPVWAGEVFIDAEDDPNVAVRYVENQYRPILKRWELPQEGADYIMGVDQAEGKDTGDYTVISIFNRTDGLHLHEACRYRGKLQPEETAVLAYKLGKEYNSAFIIPEAGSLGSATALKLAKLMYQPLFMRDNPEAQGGRAETNHFLIGFKTLKNTKPILVSEGQAALRNSQILLYDEKAITEWLHFKNEDGYYKAPNGENDDCVMSDLLAIYGHFSGKAPPVRRTLGRGVKSKSHPEESTEPETANLLRKMRARNDAKAKRLKPSRMPYHLLR